ncbi:zeta toxin family protein [Sphaerospermopsis aphanizomenoides BCCUSP55]|uniref:zeta toxin family protein n=1 Tax=Sphaerospermopsis aphanizomenoides TaxID=459663 RepID=UPI001908E741|nr:zeta toxin family protein [Sphaerospermopsis aphanizomenoides]MBK1987413.1 zeta toxin family protein [Sphaerospermopsis aphanizomenoides BCCUSP55]
MPHLYIIGGANGSGKTTVALQILPYFLEVFEYVNADQIAAALSPFNPDNVAIEAGRLMLQRLEFLVNNKTNFAFETTLSARNFARFIRECKEQSYIINLMYFWLETPELAIARVKRRVASGGHNIPEDVIRRRYERGRRNITDLYLPLCDTWTVYNNSGDEPKLVAQLGINQEVIVYEHRIWNQITAT